MCSPGGQIYINMYIKTATSYGYCTYGINGYFEEVFGDGIIVKLCFLQITTTIIKKPLMVLTQFFEGTGNGWKIWGIFHVLPWVLPSVH